MSLRKLSLLWIFSEVEGQTKKNLSPFTVVQDVVDTRWMINIFFRDFIQLDVVFPPLPKNNIQ